MADHSNSSGSDQPGNEMIESDELEKAADEKILEEALARFALSEEAEQDNRRLALDDLEFRAGNQWPDSVKAERERDGRPCLVTNRIPQFVQQIANDQRQNRPAIKVHPVDDQADVETAKIIQGIIRHVEYISGADTAYDTAFESAVTGGFGYFRITTKYVSPTSFDQEILIKRIRNPFSVYYDPYIQEPDGSDANFAQVVDDLSAEEYRALYPNSKLTGMNDWAAIGNQVPGWVKSDSCRVAEYFYKQYEEVDLVLLSNGQAIKKSDLEAYVTQAAQQAAAQNQPLELQIVSERKSRVPTIKWVKHNGYEILEKTDWLGEYIPIIPVLGTELDVNGKRILEGIVRNAKDPQRMYNYWKSAQTEAIALAPRAPFIAAKGQIEGYEADWNSANRKNHAVLYYNPKSVDGTPLPAPQRQVYEPAIQAITQAAMQASDELKSTTGIYDAALGASSNESSGIAIQRRNSQTQTSNFHYVDNLTRSIKHAGRILVDLIPKIYDGARSARIIGENDEQKVVRVNEPFQENGKPMLYALDAGKFDVTMDVGPSYATKRQEAVASMMEATRAVPQLMQLAGDIMVKNMDWPGAQEISERLKKALPPGIASDPKEGQAPLPPEVQQKMSQMGQMIKQMTDELHNAHDIIDQKRMELESRERIEMAKLHTQIEIKMAEMGSKESMALLQHEVDSISTRLKLLGIDSAVAQPQSPQSMPQFPQGQPPNGGSPAAQGGQALPQPTGGLPPGSPMEGPMQ